MNFRSAKESDLDKLCELWFELINYHASFKGNFELSSNPNEFVRKSISTRLKAANTNILVCEIGTEVVGMIISSYFEPFPALVYDKRGYIAETVVDAQYRGKGIGEKLYLEAELWLKSNNVNHIELQVSVDNIRSQEFWKQFGFSESTYHMWKTL